MLLGFFHRYGAFVESLIASTLRLVNAVERAGQFAQEIGKWLIERGGPSDNDIVVAIASIAGCNLAQSGLETAADAIARDRVAQLLCDSKAETRSFAGSASGRARFGFHQAAGHGSARPAADGEEVRTLLDGFKCQRERPRERFCPSAVANGQNVPRAPAKVLGRQALAAFGAAAGENFLATCGQHTLAEAVAAFAHKAAGLICAFHATSP